jgi:hypothetical protein
MKNKILIFGVAIFVVTISTQGAFACQCIAGISLQDEFENSDFIFSATVLDVKPGQEKEISIAPIEHWKGNVSDKVLFHSCRGVSSGGIDLEIGKSYLFFAETLTQKYPVVNDCSRTQLLSDAKDEILFLDQKSHITRFWYEKSFCEPGVAPEGNYVFFDCKWVEIPDHWNFEEGRWQEDPNVFRLGPEPRPNCPDVNVCTCSGKFNYYNFTDKRCYSSPYMPEAYQKACTQYSEMEFAGWTFDEQQCEWNAIASPYDDERLRLASKKIDVGGLGINPEVDSGTIIAIVVIGVGSALSLIVFWKKRE